MAHPAVNALKGLLTLGGNVHAQSGVQQRDGVRGPPSTQQCSTGDARIKYHLLEAEQVPAAGSFSIQESGKKDTK